MITSSILTFLIVLQVIAVMYAFWNPQLHWAWRLPVALGGTLNTMILMIFFFTQFCMWGIVVGCPILR